MVVVRGLFSVRLCVAEEMSNWDRRPFLRYSQLHYAASRLWLIYMVGSLRWLNVRANAVVVLTALLSAVLDRTV